MCVLGGVFLCWFCFYLCFAVGILVGFLYVCWCVRVALWLVVCACLVGFTDFGDF